MNREYHGRDGENGNSLSLLCFLHGCAISMTHVSVTELVLIWMGQSRHHNLPHSHKRPSSFTTTGQDLSRLFKFPLSSSVCDRQFLFGGKPARLALSHHDHRDLTDSFCCVCFSSQRILPLLPLIACQEQSLHTNIGQPWSRLLILCIKSLGVQFPPLLFHRLFSSSCWLRTRSVCNPLNLLLERRRRRRCIERPSLRRQEHQQWHYMLFHEPGTFPYLEWDGLLWIRLGRWFRLFGNVTSFRRRRRLAWIAAKIAATTTIMTRTKWIVLNLKKPYNRHPKIVVRPWKIYTCCKNPKAMPRRPDSCVEPFHNFLGCVCPIG